MTSILAQRPPAERSFERLYRAYVQDVYRYSLMLLRNRADAEDVAQTTFMKAYRAIERGDRPRHPRKWLITIAHNTCRTRARDDSRRPQEVPFDETLAEPATSTPEPDVDVPELVRALGALSFNQRAALVMRELEGRSYAEIAEVLDVSGSAVETLLFRARRALREQLEGPLTCGDAEHALSLQLDGRLGSDARASLRAHLRECADCASLARRVRARRAALRSLGPLPLPTSIASWGGAGAGSGIAVKVAAILAAGVAAAGAGKQTAKAVAEAAPAAAPVAVAAVDAPRAPGTGSVGMTALADPNAVAWRRPPRAGTRLVHDDVTAARPKAAPVPATTPASTPAPASGLAPVPLAPPISPTVAIPAVPQQPAPTVELATPEVPVSVPQVAVPVPQVAVPLPEVAVPVPPVTVPVSPPPLPVEVPILP